jgi:CheY-like chemotaxis protein
MLSRVGYGVTCPVCEGPFTLGPLDRRGAESVRQVSCANCGRGTVVTNCILVRVMVMTHVKAIAKTLRDVLTGAGHEVLEPPDTDAALDVCRENAVDVVIMDAFALAAMDGQEFIRRLRKEFLDSRIVVLAPRASHRMADPSAVATRLGATHIVRTPFTRDDILRALKEARP